MQVQVSLGLLALLLASTAAAQDDGGETPVPGARAAAAAGNFMPFAMSARSDTQRAFVATQGGYDSVREGALFRAAAQARIYGALSVRAGVAYGEPEASFRPEVGLKVDALHQEERGVDLAIAATYEPEGFNTTPAASLRLALGRSFGATQLLANVGYGASLDGERHGDLRAGVLHRLLPQLSVGLDSRFRIDLERDDDEPAGEPEWDFSAGPAASFVVGPVVLSASGGPSALKLRFGDAQLGVMGSVGVGAAF